MVSHHASFGAHWDHEPSVGRDAFHVPSTLAQSEDCWDAVERVPTRFMGSFAAVAAGGSPGPARSSLRPVAILGVLLCSFVIGPVSAPGSALRLTRAQYE